MNDRVYMVWYDNREMYEDALEYPVSIFKTWEEAESYIDEKFGKYTTKCMCNDFKSGYGTDFIRVNAPEWKEKEKYYHGCYTIRIWDIDSGKEVLYDNEHIFPVEKDVDDSQS